MTAAEPEFRPVRPPPGRPGRRKGPAPVPRPSARRTAPRRGPNPTPRNRPLPPPRSCLMGPRRPRSPRLPSRLRRCLPSGKPPPPPLLSHPRDRLHPRRFHQPSRSLEGVPPRCRPPRSRSRPRRSSLHPRRSPQRVPPSRSIGQRPCKETDPDRNPAENGTGGAAARPRCRPCRRQPFAVDLIAGGRPFGQVAEALMTVGGEEF